MSAGVAHGGPTPRNPRPVVGLVTGGLGAYWPQFPNLLPTLQSSVQVVYERLHALEAQVVDAGFVSDASEACVAGDKLRMADCDLVVMFMATYMTSSMVVPIAQRTQVPLLVLNLQPTAAMDHANVDTGGWLAYCGACSLPEVANVFERVGVPFRSVSGHLRDENAWMRVGNWIKAAAVRRVMRTGRHGLMGHLYPGMLDVATDVTLVPAQLGGHVEILEFDDLRVRVARVGAADVALQLEQVEEMFQLDESVEADELEWSARVAVGIRELVADFQLDSLAYYHRGLEGEVHERLGAGMILGASLLTAAHVPACGEYELRTSLAMLIMDRLGGGGSFTEIQALNFADDVVEMGHDGPAHIGISERRPLLRGLGLYHGKRGHGVSVEFDVAHGPVTLLGLAQMRDGRYRLVASEGRVVDGPLMKIGNTTSRVDFGRNPGEWCDEWSASGINHHWALGTGHRVAELSAVSDLLGLELVIV